MAMVESQHPGKLLWTLQGTKLCHIDRFHRKIIETACASWNKTLPELRTGFVGRNSCSAHISAWQPTIFKLLGASKNHFLGFQLTMHGSWAEWNWLLHYRSFRSAYWWKSGKIKLFWVLWSTSRTIELI